MEFKDEHHAPEVSLEEMKLPESDVHTPLTEEQTEKLNLGPVIGILIVVALLLLAGLYIWSTTLISEPPAPTPAASRPLPRDNNEPESTRAEADTQILNTVSNSDELEAIEADLESTDLESLDAELQAIEAELDAALGGL